MLQQFKSMNELVAYLEKLEERVQHLEAENRSLRAAPAGTGSVDERTIAKMVARFLPLTDVVHPSFWKRSLAIWGHWFVPNFVISLILSILYFCFLSALFSSMMPTPR